MSSDECDQDRIVAARTQAARAVDADDPIEQRRVGVEIGEGTAVDNVRFKTSLLSSFGFWVLESSASRLIK
jgi:hypothetical protein